MDTHRASSQFVKVPGAQLSELLSRAAASDHCLSSRLTAITAAPAAKPSLDDNKVRATLNTRSPQMRCEGPCQLSCPRPHHPAPSWPDFLGYPHRLVQTHVTLRATTTPITQHVSSERDRARRRRYQKNSAQIRKRGDHEAPIS